MKPLIRRLGRVRHAVATVILQGVIAVVAGLFQANTALMVGGVVTILLSAAVLVATYVVNPVVEGVVVVLQRPQLPDVRAHVPRTRELARVS